MVEPGEGVLHVTRTIPVPRSVSEHVQTVLSLTAKFPEPSQAPPADDQTAWEERAAGVDVSGDTPIFLDISGSRLRLLTHCGAGTRARGCARGR